MSHFIDIEGNKYNRLLVIGLDRKENGLVYWKCKCDCGNTLTVIGRNLKNNHTKSCGCLNKDGISVISNQKIYVKGIDF